VRETLRKDIPGGNPSGGILGGEKIKKVGKRKSTAGVTGDMEGEGAKDIEVMMEKRGA